MQRLEDLNTYGQTSILVEDNRPSGPVFDRDFDDIVLDIQSTTQVINSPPLMTELVNYSTAAMTYQVEIFPGTLDPLVGSTITFGALPPGISLNQTGNLYTLSGFTSATEWNAVKQFTWNLPVDYASKPRWTVQLRVHYYDSGLAQNTFEVTNVFDPRFNVFGELFADAGFTVTGYRGLSGGASFPSAATWLAVPSYAKTAEAMFDSLADFTVDGLVTQPSYGNFSSDFSTAFDPAKGHVGFGNWSSSATTTIVTNYQTNTGGNFASSALMSTAFGVGRYGAGTYNASAGWTATVSEVETTVVLPDQSYNWGFVGGDLNNYQFERLIGTTGFAGAMYTEGGFLVSPSQASMQFDFEFSNIRFSSAVPANYNFMCMALPYNQNYQRVNLAQNPVTGKKIVTAAGKIYSFSEQGFIAPHYNDSNNMACLMKEQTVSGMVTGIPAYHEGLSKWVVAGNGGSNIKMFWSNDGDSWSAPTTLNHITGGLPVDLIKSPTGILLLWDDGYYSFSSDGESWTAPTSLPGSWGSYGAKGIYFSAQSKFVVCGENGNVSTSSDGTSWSTTTPLPTSIRITGFADGASKLVLACFDVGPNTREFAHFYTSDGITWTGVALVSGTAIRPSLVRYGGGKFVAFYGTPTPTARVATSTDGVSWTVHGLVASIDIHGLAYHSGLGLFCADPTNSIASYATIFSSDGITWTVNHRSQNPYALVGFDSVIAISEGFVVSGMILSNMPTLTTGADVSTASIVPPYTLNNTGKCTFKGTWAQVLDTTNGIGKHLRFSCPYQDSRNYLLDVKVSFEGRVYLDTTITINTNWTA